MTIPIDEELRDICRELLAGGLSEAQWAKQEANDCFQTERYVAGFAETKAIADGTITSIEARPAD